MARRYSRALIMGLAQVAGALLAVVACSSGSVSDGDGPRPGETTSALEGCVEEGSEPNNSAALAAPLTFGATSSGALCSRLERDFYRFQGPPAGSIFSVRLEFDRVHSDLALTLYDAAGNQVARGPQYGDNRLVTATSNGGWYTALIAGEPNFYAITTALGSLPLCPEPDPDETPSGAARELALGSGFDGFSCAGEDDYYQIQGPPAGQEFTVNALFEHAEGDLALIVYDAQGRALRSTGRADSDNESVVVISNGGVYRARVYGPERRSNAYRIEAVSGYAPASSCPGEDEFEPNDRPEQATPIPLDAAVSGFLCEDRADQYTFQGPAAGTPFFATVTWGGPVDARVELVNQSGTVVASGRTLVAATEPQTAAERLGTVSDGGQYRLVLSGSSASAQPYALELSSPDLPATCASVEDSFEPNDIAAASSLIPFPGVIEAASCAGNPDQFRFQGPPAGTRFEVEVAFAEISGSVEVRLVDELGVASSRIVTLPGLVVLDRVSNGGRYRISLDPRSGELQRYTVALREATRLCSVEAEISSLGEACGIANGGPFATLAASLSPEAAPSVESGTSFTVALASTPLGNRGSVAFTAPTSGSYAFFVGTPSVRVDVRAPSGEAVEPDCLTALETSECNQLRRVYRYQLEAATRYVITLGPSFPQQFIRVAIEPTEPGTLECTPAELPDRGSICPRSLASSVVQAASLTAAGPELVEDTVTLVQLPPGSEGRAGSVTFTPALTGTYQLYSAADVPHRFVLDAQESALACAKSFTSIDCEHFRHASTVQLEGRRTYRIDFGPTAVSSLRVVVKRAEPPRPRACGATELPDVEPVCSLPPTEPLVELNAAALEQSEAPPIQDGTPTAVRLVTGSDGNAGAVTFQPTRPGSYQLFLSAPYLPFRLYDGLVELPTTCTAQWSSTECSAFRRGNRFELEAGKTYRLELGPVSPMSWVRVWFDSSND